MGLLSFFFGKDEYEISMNAEIGVKSDVKIKIADFKANVEKIKQRRELKRQAGWSDDIISEMLPIPEKCFLYKPKFSVLSIDDFVKVLEVVFDEEIDRSLICFQKYADYDDDNCASIANVLWDYKSYCFDLKNQKLYYSCKIGFKKSLVGSFSMFDKIDGRYYILARISLDIGKKIKNIELYKRYDYYMHIFQKTAEHKVPIRTYSGESLEGLTYNDLLQDARTAIGLDS